MDKHERMIKALEAMFYNGYETLIECNQEEPEFASENDLFEGVTDLLNLLNREIPDKRIGEMIREAHELHNRI